MASASTNYDEDYSDAESFVSAHESHNTPHHHQHDELDSELPSNEIAEDHDHSFANAPAIIRFPPEEEADLLQTSTLARAAGNTLFGSASYGSAIDSYESALASCPNYLDYELAVLRANIAACRLKLREWKEAVDIATLGLELLEKLDPLSKPVAPVTHTTVQEPRDAARTTTPPPLPPRIPSVTVNATQPAVKGVDEALAFRLETLSLHNHSIQQVRALRTKLLLRRATALSSLGGWSNLSKAQEDYTFLCSLPSSTSLLAPLDRRNAEKELQTLPPKLEEAKKKEMTEMMGKLKDLGNGILKPFGLSTENFNFVQDEKGGYSMQFNQGKGNGKH